MTFCLRYIFPRSSRLSAAAALALAALCLTPAGCGNVNTTSIRVSELRIIDATPNSGGIDVYANATALTYNVGFGTVSSYIQFAPGTYTVAGKQTGGQTVLASTQASLSPSLQYTLLLGNVAASLQAQLLQDQSQPAPSGQIALRFIDQATRIGAVDIYLIPQGGTLVTTMPIATSITFNNTSNAPHYIDVPAGAYTVEVLPAGTVAVATTVSAFTGAVATYPAGSARTLILLDRPLTTVPGVQVITADDYDSATATS